MNIIKILEEYKPRKIFHQLPALELWENPTSDELEDAKKEYKSGLKFAVLLKEKKVLLWNGRYSHEDVLGKGYDISKYYLNSNIITGDYFVDGTLDIRFVFDAENMKKQINQDLTWVDKYLPGWNSIVKQPKDKVGNDTKKAIRRI